jgi:hypothetical protein
MDLEYGHDFHPLKVQLAVKFSGEVCQGPSLQLLGRFQPPY